MNYFKDIQSNIVSSGITIGEAIRRFKEEKTHVLGVEEKEQIIGELDLIDFIDILKEDYSKPISPYIHKISHNGMRENEILGLIEYFKGVTANVNEIVESVPSGIIVIDNDGEIVTINRSAEKILNIKREEYLHKNINDFNEDEALSKIIENREDVCNIKHNIQGTIIKLSRAELRREGRRIGTVTVFEDISGLEKLARELEMTKDTLENIESIIESSYDGIMITDGEGRVQMVNSSWEQMCAMTRDEVVGKRAGEMVEKGYWNKSSVEKALETGKTSTVMLEMTYGRNTGQKILGTATPQFDENGKMKRIIANIRNITELDNLKSQLLQTKELTKKYSSEIMEMRRQQQKFTDIVAVSSEMQRTMEIASRAADVDATILITGESGVGKEIIARFLHVNSSRKDNAYIKINCAAIPINLLESELFGYMPGAFTGASKNGKIGLFELAHEGTLLLDEIGELPLELQVKLLRTLQNKEITRIGGGKSIQVDTRIIASTNRDLKKMIEQGKFREDLYYRLNIINIHIPPLRQRKADISPLILYFLEKYNTKYARRKIMNIQTVESLTEYDWPGNIRELENLIERLVVLTEENEIQIKHLPENHKTAVREMHSNIQVNGIMPLKKAVAEVERQLILKAKKKYGSTRRMAKVLEVDQSTIVRKSMSLNLNKEVQ